MRRWIMPAVLVLLAAFLGSLSAADWPQWRGPKRDGISPETGVKKGLTAAGGPKLAWTYRDTGRGNGTPSVVGDHLYILGERKGTEYVIKLDLKAGGKELWAVPISKTWDEKGTTPFTFTAGPNSGPTTDGDRLYALSSAGTLIALETATGKEVWKKDLIKDMKARVTTSGSGEEIYGYGFSWSPLVDGDKLIITPGGPDGLFAALDKKTGKELWRTRDIPDEATYSSPIVAEIAGVRQYISTTQFGPLAVEAATGKLLWYARREEEIGDMVCPTPIVTGNKVIFTATKAGFEVLEITRDGEKLVAKKAYKISKELSNFHGGVVLINGHIYGAHEENAWKCINLATGELAWASKAFGVGPLVAVDGVIVLQSQREDEIAIIEPNPKEFAKIGGWKVPEQSKLRKSSQRMWTPPVVANGKLFLRDVELLFCYDLK